MSLETRPTGVPKFAPADDFTPFCEAVRAIFSPALPDIGSFRMTRRPV